MEAPPSTLKHVRLAPTRADLLVYPLSLIPYSLYEVDSS